MFELPLPFLIMLSFVLGGVIGVERQINEKTSDHKGKMKSVIGLRSFALIAGLGSIAGAMYGEFIVLSALITSAFFLLVLTFYVVDTMQSKERGITTELSMCFTFIIGILLTTQVIPVLITIALSVVLILLLSQKRQIQRAVSTISSKEVNAFISFAVIALVILPFLPNESYSLTDIPNSTEVLKNLSIPIDKIKDIEIISPFKLWMIVALITGVDILGYFLERTLGKQKGWILASIAGGFISSTATTQSLAQQSKQTKTESHLLAAALIANMVSFFQVSILLGSFNIQLLLSLFPTILLLIASTGALAFYFYRKSTKTVKKSLKEDSTDSKSSIINLTSALKFAGLFLVISLVSKIALSFFGSSGFLVATGIGALIGLDAVIINTAQLAGKSVAIYIAVIGFLIANSANLLGKSFYSYLQGSTAFAKKFFLSVLAIITASCGGLFFL